MRSGLLVALAVVLAPRCELHLVQLPVPRRIKRRVVRREIDIPPRRPLQVRGYYRRDGTYVRPHTRRR